MDNHHEQADPRATRTLANNPETVRDWICRLIEVGGRVYVGTGGYSNDTVGSTDPADLLQAAADIPAGNIKIANGEFTGLPTIQWAWDWTLDDNRVHLAETEVRRIEQTLSPPPQPKIEVRGYSITVTHDGREIVYNQPVEGGYVRTFNDRTKTFDQVFTRGATGGAITWPCGRDNMEAAAEFIARLWKIQR